MDHEARSVNPVASPGFVPATFRHRGEPSAERQVVAAGSCHRHWRYSVPAGQDLLQALFGHAGQRGVDSALFRLVGGRVARLSIMTGRPDLAAGGVATFHGPHVIECPAQVLSCHGIIGRAAGGHVVHAHGIFLDAQRVARGCHLIAGECIAGAGGITVDFAPLEGVGFRQLADPETGFRLLFPVAESA